nr:putative reverse transcriptase domain-containing protein [Tanacetum cinerariifolium]
FPSEAKVERLLAMPTPSPSPLASLSPRSAGERLARCTAPAALPSPPLPPPLYMPPPVDRCISETRMPPRKRLCLSTLGSRYEMQQTEIAELRETDHRHQAQMAETLRVMGDMRREMGDMQAELLALREQPRRAGQPGRDARGLEACANIANAQRNNGENPNGNGCFECGATWHFKRDSPKLKNKDGEKVNAPGWAYAVGNTEKRGNASRDPDSNVVMVLSCSKAQEYMAKGCQIFLAHISAKKEEERSEGKQLEDVPVVRDYPEVFPKDLSGLPPA